MRILPLAVLSLFLASCAPTLGSTGNGFVHQTFASGQRWTVTAVGGDGSETVSFVLAAPQTVGDTGAVAFVNALKNPEGALNYAPASAGRPVEDIMVIWDRPNNVDGFCVIRNPSAVTDRKVFSGRYARSFERAQDYARTGATTGTGTCDLKREG